MKCYHCSCSFSTLHLFTSSIAVRSLPPPSSASKAALSFTKSRSRLITYDNDMDNGDIIWR